MSKTMLNKSMHRSRRGLVLLLALGMLALFSLLAVTYIVAASNSRAGAQAMKIRANASNTSTIGLTDQVLKQAIRGTRDQKSAFYQHSLLEDVFDSRSIKVRFGHRTQPLSIPQANFRNPWCVRLTPQNANPVVEIAKVSLDPRNPKINAGDPSTYLLHELENSYNSRILTVIEGPLTGYSFRILKYVGFVNDGSYVDRNYSDTQTYSRPDAYDYDYSVAIDLSDVKEVLQGRWTNPSTGKVESYSGSITDWLQLPNGQGLRNLFYFYDSGSGRFEGYRCVINGGAFTNSGIGIEDTFDPSNPIISGYGNLDARRWLGLKLPGVKVPPPPALLPHYDYLQDARVMVNNGGTVGVDGIGDDNYQAGLPRIRGQSNEGYDVPDWRDFWLAHQDRIETNAGVTPYVIPSFHKPELVNYIAHLFGNPSSLADTDVRQLLLMLDASTARVLSYRFGTDLVKNPNFNPGVPSVSLGGGLQWSTPPTPAEISTLREFVRAQIVGLDGVGTPPVGQWDVDNDGDGFRESVWIDPNLPTIHAPDGRMLKPLAAIHIEDLDGRINLNLHGDRIQGRGASFNAFADTAGFLRANLNGPVPLNLPQGFGFGPADISLNQLFLFEPRMLASSPSNYSFFDERYGANRLRNSSAAVDLVTNDRSPGRTSNAYGVYGGVVNWLRQRESRLVDPGNPNQNPAVVHGRLPGAVSGRRTSVAPAFDRNGNLSFVHPEVIDHYPVNPSLPARVASEVVGDPYEASAGLQSYGDTPFTLGELERILRRFDDDVQSLPDHVSEHFKQFPGYDNLSEINRVITTRSAELRLPKLAAAASILDAPGGVTIEKDAGNLLGLIRLIHEQRYRQRSFPPNPATDEPRLDNESLYRLFPVEFASNLRLDINRAFGNGHDDNGNGNVDEPVELETGPEREFTTLDGQIPQQSAFPGLYRINQRDVGSNSRRYLGSRQMLARYLYCLGQLIIPREYEFPSMRGETVGSFQWYRLRARSIAQWAVNVVDFRDADTAMTRFEYDILPFGYRPPPTPPSKAPPGKKVSWSPDESLASNTTLRQWIDVVWGMEMPELLLTESLNFHDKRLRDTDLDNNSGKVFGDGDEDVDQYRFPEGSTFIELYAPRTTYIATDNRIAGVSSSLYQEDAGLVKLNLSKLAPSSPTWGRQPVWRIGINPSTPPTAGTPPPPATRQPNLLYQDNSTSIYQRDFQASKDRVLRGDPSSTVAEVIIGSGLHDSLTNLGSTTPPTVAFERMIWMSNESPASLSLTRIPNLIGNDKDTDENPNLRSLIYYNRSGVPALLEGGSYAVVGPRRETSLGSLTHNPDTGTPWISKLLSTQIAASTNRPVRSSSHQVISLGANDVATKLLSGETVFRYRTEWQNVTKPALGIVCASDTPPETSIPPSERWSACFPDGVGINISMPNPILGTGYWRDANKPLQRLNTDDRRSSRSDDRYGYGDLEVPPDSWVDCTSTPIGRFPDKPFDYNPATNEILSTMGQEMNRTGTYPNVRTAFLQRLADPDRGYDPENNPYITVDWISLDLTVFNGEAPVSDDSKDSASGKVALQSRYKDGSDRKNAFGKNTIDPAGQPTPLPPKVTQGGVEVWGYSYHSFSTAKLRETRSQSFVPLDPPATGPGSDRFPSYFMHQLGYTSQQPPDVNGSQPKHHSATTLGYANVGYRFGTLIGDINDDADNFDGFGPPQSVPGNPLYNGTPRDLTSLVWFNRPFATPGELMMVPLTSPGQFGLFHSIADKDKRRTPFEYLPSFGINNALITNLSEVTSSDPSNPSDWNDYNPTPSLNDRNKLRAQGYWLKRTGSWSAQGPKVEADWSLLFEFIETKPPFLDSAKFLEPDTIRSAATSNAISDRFLNSFIPANFTGNGEPLAYRGPTLLAPTNEIPNYIAAGKINLNTITLAQNGRSEALQALEYLYVVGAQRTGAIRDGITRQFFRSRRGFDGGGTSLFFGTASLPSMDPNYPTQFAGAFQSGLASNIQPRAPYPDPSNREPAMQQRGRYPVESGILRSYSPNQSVNAMVNDATSGAMLFSPDAIANDEDSTVPAANDLEEEDAKRNAFTRYQRAMRLPNLVTDQSNVFAVWVTVGLFEYDPINGFGREYVNASGEEQRERSFYIIDRTVPVGFIPGEDLNTQKTILLRRKISGDR